MADNARTITKPDHAGKHGDSRARCNARTITECQQATVQRQTRRLQKRIRDFGKPERVVGDTSGPGEKMTWRRILHNFFGLESRRRHSNLGYAGVERRQSSIKHRLNKVNDDMQKLNGIARASDNG